MAGIVNVAGVAWLAPEASYKCWRYVISIGGELLVLEAKVISVGGKYSQRSLVVAEVKWWAPKLSGWCQSPVVGVTAEWWALQPSGGHCSQVVGIRAKWWVPQLNGGIGDWWWDGGHWRPVAGVRAQWQVCTRVQWWVCSQMVGCVWFGKRSMSVAVVSNSVS